ncbi:hypothetical protein GDO86_012376 [Hymenochirus boettgeri]|uniref:Ferritin n=1 Tax=Hymenochirus boettgeri TaxID=247094 RepID=A0A8T2IQF6_9PIPI|nr:hypothetical protein GDO86_012376 [Hymenochirus boettgeri]
MDSQVRQNYSHDCEAGVNRMVNLEMYASYTYLSVSYYFERDDVALHHVAEFFKDTSKERRECAEKLMKYQNKRGGRNILMEIKLCDCLESDHLDEHVKKMKKLGDHITNLKRLGVPQNGMGDYLFDKHSMS